MSEEHFANVCTIVLIEFAQYIFWRDVIGCLGTASVQLESTSEQTTPGSSVRFCFRA